MFDEAQLARSLRRGPEVDRFNELVARQEGLTPAESDELYRYRLRRLLTRARRLEQAAGATDEEAMRQALDDFRARHQELRTLESLRRQAGLWAEYDVDRTAEERAITRLLELAAQRPRGLIAGSENAPDQPSGSVRIREEEFAASPDDVPVYILAPASVPSESLAQHVEAVAAQGARLHLVRDHTEIPQGDPPAVVLNWGSTQALPPDIVALNRPEAVRVSSDQGRVAPTLTRTRPANRREPRRPRVARVRSSGREASPRVEGEGEAGY